MALTQVSGGASILASDINQFYNILKGVAASGESITLVYNAASAIILQPSSDPAADTVAIAIKNTVGTQQSGLTYDGNAIFKTYAKIGPNPASSGAIRIANNTQINARNAANGADINLIALNASDQVSINSGLLIVTTSTVTAVGVPFVAPAATTSIPSVRLPHGTAPSAPTNGDMWTTTAGLFVRINGATVGPLS
jgi:hypothetical protein